jgi:hypothetical protein
MSEQEKGLNFAAVAALICAVIGGIVAFVYFPGEGFVPIIGLYSLATIYSVIAVIAGVGVTMFGFRFRDLEHTSAVHQELHRRARRDWFQRIVAGASMGILLGMATAILFYVLSRAFIGAGIQWWMAVILGALFGLIIGWFTGGIASGFTDKTLISIGLYLAFGTLLFAAVVTSNTLWWQFSASNLGTVYGSDMFFNLGVAMTGGVILAYALSINRLHAMLHKHGKINTVQLRLLQVGFVVCGLGVLIVGLFPYWYRPNYGLIHDIGSHSALVAFCVLMFFGTRLSPIYPPVYRNVSIAIGVGSLMVIVLLVTGLALFAIAEVLWFILWGSWLYINEEFTTSYLETAPDSLLT